MASLTALSGAYEHLEATGTLPEEVWDDWLWRTDPNEKYSPEVLMNRSHLLGLLVCIYKSREHGEAAAAAAAQQQLQAGERGGDERLTLMEKPVARMTLRELKDTVENLQIEWPAFLQRLPSNPSAQANLDAVILTIDQCAARFGHLCTREGGEDTFDDLGSVEEVSQPESGVKLLRLTPACMRRTLCSLLVLYRHLHLLAVAQPLPEGWFECGITKYHVEASGDDFNALCMHLSLPVAAKLNYQNDFPEMYNHVSQAVFFHNPEYQRTTRTPLEQLGPASPAEQVLPSLWQLYPDIDVRYEEEHMPALMHPGVSAEARWAWLVVAGRVYLVRPDKAVLYSPSVTSLLVNGYLAGRQTGAG